jgi:hypothetical protein
LYWIIGKTKEKVIEKAIEELTGKEDILQDIYIPRTLLD